MKRTSVWRGAAWELVLFLGLSSSFFQMPQGPLFRDPLPPGELIYVRLPIPPIHQGGPELCLCVSSPGSGSTHLLVRTGLAHECRLPKNRNQPVLLLLDRSGWLNDTHVHPSPARNGDLARPPFSTPPGSPVTLPPLPAWLFAQPDRLESPSQSPGPSLAPPACHPRCCQNDLSHLCNPAPRLTSPFSLPHGRPRPRKRHVSGASQAVHTSEPSHTSTRPGMPCPLLPPPRPLTEPGSLSPSLTTHPLPIVNVSHSSTSAANLCSPPSSAPTQRLVQD